MVPLNLGLSFVVLGAPLWYPSLLAHIRGSWSHAGLRPLVPNGLPSGSQWPIHWFLMAHPLVPNGPPSGSQWPTFWFPMAHLPVLNGPSSGSQWPVLCGPSPGYISRAPCSPHFGSRPSPRIASSFIFNPYCPICPCTFIFIFIYTFLSSGSLHF